MLLSRERLAGGRYRWQLNALEVAELDAVASALAATVERAVADGFDGDELAELEAAAAEASEALEDARAQGDLVMREILVSEVDRIGEDARREHLDDPYRAVSAENRAAIGASLVRYRGAEVADGLATYRGMPPIDRDLVQRCWHEINDVTDDEVAALLGSREATT